MTFATAVAAIAHRATAFLTDPILKGLSGFNAAGDAGPAPESDGPRTDPIAHDTVSHNTFFVSCGSNKVHQ
jgi:hypothetical protein